MRKIFTLIASVMALAASAQTVSADMVESVSEEPVAPIQAMVGIHKATDATPVAATVDALVGSFVTSEREYTSKYGYWRATQMTITKDETDPNTLIITGLPGQLAAYPIKATVDANGKLSIAAGQQVSKSSTYGEMYLRAYLSDGSGTLTLSEDPITFTYYSDGHFELDQYAVVRAYKKADESIGTLTPTYRTIKAYVPNAIYSESRAADKNSLGSPTPKEYNVYIPNTEVDSIEVLGFAGTMDVYIKLSKSAGKSHIDYSQNIYYYTSSYDYCHANPITYDVAAQKVTCSDKKADVTGTLTGGTISFESWALYMESKTTAGTYSSMNGFVLSSSITLNDGKEFVIPEETTAISAVETSAACPAVRKMVQNGQLVIVKGDKAYNVAGASLK